MITATESAFAFSPRRVAAMMLRYWYLLRSSWPRLIELIYWPAVQMITWGFIQYYVMQNGGFFARAGGTLIGAVLLASHNMHEVERLCERVIIMKQGRIEDDDTPARLLTRYGRHTLEEVFLDVARGRDEAEAAQ